MWLWKGEVKMISELLDLESEVKNILGIITVGVEAETYFYTFPLY